MTNSFIPFSFKHSFKSPDYYEQLQIEFAGLASDMRMLGFEEKTIEGWLKGMWDIERRKALTELIQHFKLVDSEYTNAIERMTKIKNELEG